MTADIVERIRRSARYRDVDAALVERLATEELPKSRNGDEAVKRVKRRLHQAVGAFRGSPPPALAAAWSGDLRDPDFRAACLGAMRSHASTRERIGHLDRYYPGIWSITGVPSSVLDLGCGLNPLALPWMALAPDAAYLAIDGDERPLAAVRGFLDLVGPPHEVVASDLVAEAPTRRADVALLLKLVTTLDRQDPEAAARLLRGLDAGHAVVSFTTRSLSGRRGGMEPTYRRRLDRLVADAGRVSDVGEASVANELVFVLTLDPSHG
jgi:16S rRNA (guanine(1405)-N(7))-methyltransferase